MKDEEAKEELGVVWRRKGRHFIRPLKVVAAAGRQVEARTQFRSHQAECRRAPAEPRGGTPVSKR